MINIFAKNALESEREIIIEINGDCMAPLLNPKQKVLIKPVNKYTNIEIGNVVLFEDKSTNNFVVHRVNYVLNEFVITSGDNNPFYDPIIKKNEILGLVCSQYNPITITNTLIKPLYFINSVKMNSKFKEYCYTDSPEPIIRELKSLNYSIVAIHNKAKIHLIESDIIKTTPVAYFFGYEFNDDKHNHIPKNLTDAILRTEVFPQQSNIEDEINAINFLYGKGDY
ncbi:hypothetical protein MHI01_29180 [Paenibacillus sp. FSL M7-0656]|uniref:hypothetical protein n=1 Tax=Paenibacillus sp. FSL M7-0656 TaxID=2921534 RepID=UPI0030FBB474